ncbi:hypothetical protein ACIHFE_20755 [Streptomyces sp. NPDC052396]|uniref:hypothetical protein n=1 Tax=Streptomyces sp. NPDC052396 TaxID=3365689 RepID=UPI0037CD352D
MDRERDPYREDDYIEDVADETETERERQRRREQQPPQRARQDDESSFDEADGFDDFDDLR